MTRNTLLIDAAIAAILTILIVVLSPGLAVVGLIAILVVIVCGVSFALDTRRRRKAPRSRRRRPSVRELEELAALTPERPRRQPSRRQPARRQPARRQAQRRRPRPRP